MSVILIIRRLVEHNSGKTIFSKRFKPWSILYKENFDNLEEAVKKEKYFKSAAGRRWMRKNLFEIKRIAGVVELVDT